MKLSLEKKELKRYLENQINQFFPDNHQMQGGDIDCAFDTALKRMEFCFKSINNPAYSNNKGEVFFSHLHGDQYAQFLYFFSNSLWEHSQNKVICDKIIYLNRILNNFFFSYKAKLPDVFFFGHPVGTILGNAVYNDYLVVFQNVTVNTSSDSVGNPAPVLGKGLFLAAGATIIGNRTIGDRVSIGVNTLIYNQEIMDDRVAITDKNGKLIIKKREKEKCMAQNYFWDEI